MNSLSNNMINSKHVTEANSDNPERRNFMQPQNFDGAILKRE